MDSIALAELADRLLPCASMFSKKKQLGADVALVIIGAGLQDCAARGPVPYDCASGCHVLLQ